MSPNRKNSESLTQKYSAFEIPPSKKGSEVIKEMGDFLNRKMIILVINKVANCYLK